MELVICNRCCNIQGPRLFSGTGPGLTLWSRSWAWTLSFPVPERSDNKLPRPQVFFAGGFRHILWALPGCGYPATGGTLSSRLALGPLPRVAEPVGCRRPFDF